MKVALWSPSSAYIAANALEELSILPCCRQQSCSSCVALTAIPFVNTESVLQDILSDTTFDPTPSLVLLVCADPFFDIAVRKEFGATCLKPM